VAPGVEVGKHFRQRSLQVHRARVDVGEGGLPRNTPSARRKSDLLAYDVDQIGDIGGVDHGDAVA
jgi:hypothetical protein